MIIEGFELSKHGNAQVRVSDDNRTETFALLTHKNLPYTHRFKNLHLWQMTDYDKERIENEIKNYVSQFGTYKQKRIVFANNAQDIRR